MAGFVAAATANSGKFRRGHSGGLTIGMWLWFTWVLVLVDWFCSENGHGYTEACRVAVLYRIPEEGTSASVIAFHGESNTVFHAHGFKDELLCLCLGEECRWVQEDEAVCIFETFGPVNEGPEGAAPRYWNGVALESLKRGAIILYSVKLELSLGIDRTYTIGVPLVDEMDGS